MEEMISKSAIMKSIEEQIADYSKQLKRELFAEDLVTIYERCDTLKNIYDEIKDMPALFGDCADKSNDFTAKELQLGAEINDLKIRLKFANCEVEKLAKERNELLEKLNDKIESKKCGEWRERMSTPSSVKCTVCGHYHEHETPFCPSCGADMRAIINETKE